MYQVIHEHTQALLSLYNTKQEALKAALQTQEA